MNWKTTWEITLYLLKNHFLQLLGYIIFLTIIFLIVSIVYSILLYRFKLLKRDHKAYNYCVKLYIPAIFIINLYFGFQIGVLYGGYRTLKKETHNLSKLTLDYTAKWVFKSEEEKIATLGKLQETIATLKNDNQNLKLSLQQIVRTNNTNVALIDKGKDKLAETLVSKYGDRIHSLALYGMLSAAPHVKISDQMSFEDFDAAIQLLLKMDHKDIEASIIQKLNGGIQYILKAQYNTLLKSTLLIWLAIMLIPVVEYTVYRYWQKRKAKAANI